MHGSGDDNVHYQGTERLVNRLVELGKPFDLMVYPNRTHSISEGPGTTAHVYQLIGRYFVTHLAARSAVRRLVEKTHERHQRLERRDQRRVELAAVRQRGGELGAAVELAVLQKRCRRMIGRDSRAAPASSCRPDSSSKRLRNAAARVMSRISGHVSAMCSRMRTSSGGSGRHIPPPIHTHPGAISK